MRLLESPWARVAAAQIAVMLSLQALNLAVAVPQPNAADPSGYYAWGRSWLEDGDSDPANQLTVGVVFPVIEINGRPTLVNRYPIGWSAAVFPFMVLGKQMLGTSGAHYRHIGLAPLVVRVAWIGVYLWILFGVLATYDSIRRLLGLRAAVLGTIAAWLGTGAFGYTWKAPAMVHAITLPVISITYWCAVRARRSRYPQFWSLLWGFFASLTVCARVVDGLVVLPSFLLLLLSLRASDEQQAPPPGSRTRTILTCCIWALAGFLPLTLFQMSIWHSVYARWYFDGYAATGFRFKPSLHTLALSLFSPHKGSLLWHPVVLLALSGLGLAAFSTPRDKSTRPLAASLVALIVVMFALYGSWDYWSLGDSYGARWTADLFWIWAFGLALLFTRGGRMSRATLGAAAVFSLVSFSLICGQLLGKISLF